MKRRRGSAHHVTVQGPTPTASDAGAEAARVRVAALLERLARVDLQVVIVAPPDPTRLGAQGRARSAAIAAGRGDLLEASVEAVREATLRTFAQDGFSGTWALTRMSVSVAGAGDRVAASAAFEEAAMAAVVEDLVDDDTLDVLRSTAGELVDLSGLPSPGALSSIGPAGRPGYSGPLEIAIVSVGVVFGVLLLFVSAAAGILVLALGLGIAAWVSRRRGSAAA